MALSGERALIRGIFGTILVGVAAVLAFGGISLILLESEDTSQSVFYIVGGLVLVLAASLAGAGMLLLFAHRVNRDRWPPLMAAVLFVGLVATVILRSLTT